MQYNKAFTDALQFIWGEGFLSPGGPEEIAQMLSGHDISGKRVLDIGSGLGGIDALLVTQHGAGHVVGIDVEAQLIDAARDFAAAKGLSDRISFQLVEPGPLPLPDASFDMVFSKDAMVHIPDKAALYGEVLRVLKPGGWFVAADWLWAAGAESSPIVRAWLAGTPLSFAYTTPPEARSAMLAAGFQEITIVDRRRFLEKSNGDLVQWLEGPARHRLIEIIGEKMALERIEGSRGRQRALESGNLIPSHISGRKRR
jgi:phosphoethanolamine N-methyltransferase